MNKYWIILVLFSCAQVTSLNLRKHQFGQLPTKIVWIQVAGLTEEHLALLKYSYPSSDNNTAFEDALCIGKTWEYNLYDLRPSAYSGFMSQLTGKKNIKNSCEDYSYRPVWSYVKEKGYKVGMFEGEMKSSQSLLQAEKCNKSDFLSGLFFWKMSKNVDKDANLFHANQLSNYENNKVYYDRSCMTGECFSTLSVNVEKTFEQFSRNVNNYLYIIRDFNFQNSLEAQNVRKAKDELNQLNKLVAYFQKEADKRTDFLLIVSSSAAKNVEFPRSGKQWEAYEKNGNYLQNKKSQLISSVFVNGARAENFCGFFHQSHLLSRIFSGAKQQGLELTIINPFE